MAKTEVFNDLEQVRAHKLQLRAERDQVQANLIAQLQLVREPRFRRAILGDAIGDILQAWRPLKTISRMLGGMGEASSTTLGAVLGARATTPGGRLLAGLAGVLLPLLLEKLSTEKGFTQEKLSREVQISWQRVKDYIAARRSAYQQEDNT